MIDYKFYESLLTFDKGDFFIIPRDLFAFI